MGSLANSNLPIIDFCKESSLSPGTAPWLSTANQVFQALQEYGCFAVKYDTISEQLHDKVFEASEEMFDLPEETKVKNASKQFGFGYSGSFKTMCCEYLGIEDAATLQGTKSFTDALWPAGNHAFCETAFAFSKQLEELMHVVLRMVFESCNISDSNDYYESHIKSLAYLMRFIKYKAPVVEDDVSVVGLHSHTDKGFLTVVDQNLVKGLEIETRDGEWIQFWPSSSTFLVLAGDAFMAWSNGQIPAPFHRVTMTGNEPKYTIALFSFVRGTLEIPEVLIDDENPKKFKSFDNFEYLQYCCVGGGMKHKCPIKVYCGL